MRNDTLRKSSSEIVKYRVYSYAASRLCAYVEPFTIEKFQEGMGNVG
jgi:hypothetical protein